MTKVKLIFKAAVLAVSAVIFAAGIFFAAYGAAAQLAPVKIKIKLSREYQTFEGFGMSACWTFQDVGGSDEATARAAGLLYGEEGMKLQVYRYNIGAGSKETDCAYKHTNRATESFFISGNYESAQSFSDPANYDFTRDGGAMNAFNACLATGDVRTVVLFANSPHYLLTENGFANGTGNYENNLPEENYGAFSDYLLITAGHFAKELAGRDIKLYISPVNEPQWKWGDASGQEGCHFDPKPLAKFYDVFCNKLAEYNAENGTEILPDLFECGTYLPKGKYKKYIKEFKKYGYFDGLEHLSFHSYHANNGTFYRNVFSSYADKKLKGKKIHMSEYCEMRPGTSESIERGLYSAGVAMKDLTLISATQWCWWLGAAEGGYEDGLVYYDAQAGGYNFRGTKRYYALSQFTRYISAGDTRVYAATGDKLKLDGVQLCAFRKPDGKVSLVIINDRNFSRKIKLPAGFEAESAVCTDGTRNLEEIPAARDMQLPAESITTVTLRENDYAA